jgi:hypothetical protein
MVWIKGINDCLINMDNMQSVSMLNYPFADTWRVEAFGVTSDEDEVACFLLYKGTEEQCTSYLNDYLYILLSERVR